MTFARRILHVCWEAILDVLSTVLNGKSATGVSNSLSLLLAGKEESRKAKQTICSCLDGLQKAARLSCVLGIFFASDMRLFNGFYPPWKKYFSKSENWLLIV